MVGYVDVAAYHRFLELQGGYATASEPTEKALSLGCAKAAVSVGSWLWAEDFVGALMASLEMPRCPDAFDASSPERADRTIRWGIRLAVGDRLTRRFEAPDEGEWIRPDTFETTILRLMDWRIVRRLCRARGAKVAMSRIHATLQSVLCEVDWNNEHLVEGVRAIQEGVAMLAGMGDDHPYVRYGLMPAAGEGSVSGPWTEEDSHDEDGDSYFPRKVVGPCGMSPVDQDALRRIQESPLEGSDSRQDLIDSYLEFEGRYHFAFVMRWITGWPAMRFTDEGVHHQEGVCVVSPDGMAWDAAGPRCLADVEAEFPIHGNVRWDHLDDERLFTFGPMDLRDPGVAEIARNALRLFGASIAGHLVDLPKAPVPAADELAVIAAAQGFPAPASDGATHNRLFAVWEGSRPVAVVDRNGMKWRNAMMALLTSGAFGCADPDHAEDMLSDLDLLPLDKDAVPGEWLIKAPRRAAGTAPVTVRNQERYEGLLAALEADEEDYPLPDLDKDAKAVIDGMSREYRRRKESGLIKATPAQIKYARALYEQAGMPLPFDVTTAGRNEVSQLIAHMTGLGPDVVGRD